jgi:hypothetical protein
LQASRYASEEVVARSRTDPPQRALFVRPVAPFASPAVSPVSSSNLVTSSSRSHLVSATIVLAWILAVLAGGLHAWAGRYYADPDTISYLDMADAYLRGDWSMALNGWWNPLYTWLLCGLQVVFEPAPSFEYPAVRLLNLGVFLGGLGTVQFMSREFVRWRHVLERERHWNDTVALPDWAVYALASVLHVWSGIELIGFEQGADLLVAGLTYFALGWLLRMARDPESLGPYLALGLTLGCAYLTKAVMLPLALPFLIVAAWLARPWRRAGVRTSWAAGAFAACALPFIVALSDAKGRFTYGDTGKSNYALYVSMKFANNWSPPYFHWRGEVPGSGTPLHPTRLLMDQPPVYEFGEPFEHATYGAWYDPSHWYAGVRPTFDAANQLHVLRQHAEHYFGLFFARQPALVATLLVLIGLSWRRLRCLRSVASLAVFTLPAAAALGLYALVHVEDRFVGGHVVALWLFALAGVRIPANDHFRGVTTIVSASLLVTLFLSAIVSPALADTRDIIRRQGGADDTRVRIASKLAEIGVSPGTKVAHVGDTFYAMWARPARVHIVAEITRKDADAFWYSDTETKTEVRSRLLAAGATVLVSDHPPQYDDGAGWFQVDEHAEVFACILDPGTLVRHTRSPSAEADLDPSARPVSGSRTRG